MGSKPLTVAAFSLATAVVVAGLAGCAAEAAPPSETTAPVEEPSTAPTEEPSPEPTDDILFTVTANVRAADGRTIGISMAGHAPIASTDSDATEIREKLLEVCGGSTVNQPITEESLAENGSTLMRISIDSTASDLTFETPVELVFGSPYFAQAATGQGISPVADGVTCHTGFAWAKSGTVLGVASFLNPDGQPDFGQWKTGMYGFFVKQSSGATIEACKATITDVGMKENVINLPGWNPNTAGDGISCKIGYAGE